VTAAVVAVVLAAATGWLLRGASLTDAPPVQPQSQPAVAGPLSLVVDGSWTPVERVPGMTVLDPASTAAFLPAPGLEAYAIVTIGPLDDPSLLPASVRTMVRGDLPAPRTTKLLGGTAWTYPELWLRDDRRMEVSVVPTTAGVVAVTCVAPRASWVAATGCSAGVRRLSLGGAERLRPSAGLVARTRLPAVISKLDARRVTLRKKLRAATTRRGQARFSKRLSRAYGAAAARLSTADGATAKVAARLRASAAAQKRLSAAAANGWPKRYRQARRDVKRGDAALERALAAVR
jgi:hypothetical protein